MLQPFFEWMGQTWVSKAISASIWIYPLDQAIHLVFVALFAGAVLIVDLRLLGWGMKEQPLAQVARDAQRWLIGGLLGLAVTGIPQLIQNASREYFSEFFWYKMYLLAAGLIFTFTIRRKVTQAPEPGVLGRIVGFVSIVLWAGVVMNARLIGLFS